MASAALLAGAKPAASCSIEVYALATMLPRSELAVVATVDSLNQAAWYPGADSFLAVRVLRSAYLTVDEPLRGPAPPGPLVLHFGPDLQTGSCGEFFGPYQPGAHLLLLLAGATAPATYWSFASTVPRRWSSASPCPSR